MAVKKPDIYEHNNPNNAFVDSDFLRGSFRTPVSTVSALYSALPVKLDQLKEHATVVYVTGNSTFYELCNISKVACTDLSGWREFGSSTASVINAANGLSVSNKNVVLGGKPLTGATTINQNDYGFRLVSQTGTTYAMADFRLNNTYSSSRFGICSRDAGTIGWGLSGNSTSISASHFGGASSGSSMTICNTGIVLTNTCSSSVKTVTLNKNAFVYCANYCADYTNRTLVDKEYVDKKVSGSSNLVNVYRTTVNYSAQACDDFIGANGGLTIYLYYPPATGQTVTVANLDGTALANPITIDGNGKCINGLAYGTSTINTDYGSARYTYNGIFWSPSAFVN